MGVTCWVPTLAKDQRVLVSVRALLWMDTLQQVLSPPGDTGVARVPMVSLSCMLAPGHLWEAAVGMYREMGAPLAASTLDATSAHVPNMSPTCPHVCPQPEHLLQQFLIQSHAWFNTSAMPYRVQPRVLPAGEATVGLARAQGTRGQAVVAAMSPTRPLQAVTEVVRATPGGEGTVPVQWVVLGALAGLLLLTLLILLMWKVSGWQGDTGDTSDTCHGGGTPVAPE